MSVENKIRAIREIARQKAGTPEGDVAQKKLELFLEKYSPKLKPTIRLSLTFGITFADLFHAREDFGRGWHSPPMPPEVAEWLRRQYE